MMKNARTVWTGPIGNQLEFTWRIFSYIGINAHFVIPSLVTSVHFNETAPRGYEKSLVIIVELYVKKKKKI